MKYIYPLLALTLAVAVSCSEKLPSNDDPDAPFETPAHWKEAVKMAVTTPGSQYKTLEMSESGLFMIRTEVGLQTGDYRFDHPTYQCEGFGEVEVIETTTRAEETETLPSRIVIRRNGHVPVTVDVTVIKGSSTASPEVLDKLCRTWTPEKTIISVTGGMLPESLGIAHAENGCDLPGIQRYLDGNGLEIDADLSGYVVKDVTFSRAGTFLIRFTGAEPYEGDYSLDAQSSFRYVFDGSQMGNPLINAEAEGNVSFEKVNDKSVCEITVRSTLDAEAGYIGKIIIRLLEK